MTLESINLSRRRLLAAAGAVTAAGAIAAACGGDSSPSPGTSAGSNETPRRGGTLRINQTFGDIQLNIGYPFLGFLGRTQNTLLSTFNAEALVRYGKDIAKPDLVLADRFEYNADYTKLMVSLKPGLTFHNGAPVTTDDVFFGIDFLNDPRRFGVTLAGITTPLAKAITDRRKVDDRTMEFSFDKPHYDMTGFFVGLPLTHAASFPKLLSGESVQATGPYAFKGWTSGVGFSLVRNPNWHRTGATGEAPYPDAVEAKNFADEEAAGTAFAAGEIDILYHTTGAVAKKFRSQVTVAPRIGALGLVMVVTNPMLKDKRVRQAIFYAIDKERINKELGEGFFKATSQFWPEYSPAFDKSLEVASYDPARSKALLKEAGFSQDRSLAIEYTTRLNDDVQVVQENLNAVGIKTNLVPIDIATSTAKSRNRQFTDMFGTGTNLGDPIPASALANNIAFAIPNMASQESPELADIYRAMATVDPLSAEAKAIYARFNKVWMDDPWLVPLENSGALDVVSHKVGGYGSFFIQPLQAVDWGKVWLRG